MAAENFGCGFGGAGITNMMGLSSSWWWLGMLFMLAFWILLFVALSLLVLWLYKKVKKNEVRKNKKKLKINKKNS